MARIAQFEAQTPGTPLQRKHRSPSAGADGRRTIDGKVFLSVDRGETWREVVSPEGGQMQKLALTSACPRSLLVATPRGLFDGVLAP